MSERNRVWNMKGAIRATASCTFNRFPPWVEPSDENNSEASTRHSNQHKSVNFFNEMYSRSSTHYLEWRVNKSRMTTRVGAGWSGSYFNNMMWPFLNASRSVSGACYRCAVLSSHKDTVTTTKAHESTTLIHLASSVITSMWRGRCLGLRAACN